ncbi:MAG: gliding motility-associated C-terminal domain-containing protein, partial [Bacteroidia bacterium]|nr:gliding motility-associated C-terminal domain-containing protein [Bacteroidia bacterium]
AGTYTVTLIVNAGLPCSDTVDYVLTLLNNIVQSQFIYSVVPCTDSVIFFNSSLNTSSFAWNFGDGTNNYTANPKHNFVNNGTYTVTLISSPGTMCADTFTDVITLVALQVLSSFTADSVYCFTGSLPVTFINSSAPDSAQYSWNFGDGTFGTGSGDQTHIYTQSGYYTVTLTVSDSAACNFADSSFMHISANYQPSVNLGNDSVFCAGTLAGLILDAGNAGMSYLWNDASTLQTLTISATGNYFVTVSDGPCFDRDTIKFSELLPAAINFSNGICDAGNIQLDAGAEATSYLWSNGDTSRVVSINTPGIYWVEIQTGTCTSDDTLAITDLVRGSSFYIPNSFTPNNNHVNEVFAPIAVGISDYTLQIIDRWGEKIFESKEVTEGWDGTINGRKAEEGMYVWIVDYSNDCEGGQYHHKVGHVNVIR